MRSRDESLKRAESAATDAHISGTLTGGAYMCLGLGLCLNNLDIVHFSMTPLMCSIGTNLILSTIRQPFRLLTRYTSMNLGFGFTRRSLAIYRAEKAKAERMDRAVFHMNGGDITQCAEPKKIARWAKQYAKQQEMLASEHKTDIAHGNTLSYDTP